MSASDVEHILAEMGPDPIVSLALFIMLGLVLILPFKVKKVEENLEPFFFVMGVLAVTVTHFALMIHAGLPMWTSELLLHALESPIGIVKIDDIPVLGIFQVVLVVGLIIYFFNKPIYSALLNMMRKIGMRTFTFVFIVLFGLLSSVMSVIVCSVLLAEIALATPLERKKKIEFIVIACFAVGLGAALTPIGEPLSTIAVRKLSGPPYYADFFYLIDLIGLYVVTGIVALGVYGAYRVGNVKIENIEIPEYTERIRAVIIRAVKVYIFVAALELLGAGCAPIIVWYISHVPAWGLYWVNMISAFLDNATLTAAEIGPSLTEFQIKSALMGLLVAGGMLVPGNIPNIVAAARMKITMGEWARIGVPLGFVLMSVYFAWLYIPELL
ncbi:MAG: DUF1646 family protein [Archaeoglobaceae archaeon]